MKLPQRYQTRAYACGLAVMGGSAFLALLHVTTPNIIGEGLNALYSAVFIIGASVVLTWWLWLDSGRTPSRLIWRAVLVTATPIALLGAGAAIGTHSQDWSHFGVTDLGPLTLWLILNMFVGLLVATMKTFGLVWLVPILLTLTFRDE